MSNRKKPITIILICVLFLVLAACAQPTEEPAAPPPLSATDAPVAEPTKVPDEPTAPSVEPTDVPEPEVVELFGDSLRGGLLYDKWWVPLGLDEPTEDHPLWATQETNTRSGKDTWRCKECHGWDYKGVNGAYGSGSHMTGFEGVFQLSFGDANEILGAMQGAGNSDHDFSTVMDEQALIDISLFISQDMLNYSTVIGEDKAAISTQIDTGEVLFRESCSDCHGPKGNAIDFKSAPNETETISTLANGNPWEFLHKVRFGQPTEPGMPPALDAGWTVEEQAGVLAYAQSLPAENLATQGGLLYDKFWKAMGIDAPEGDQPLWATQTTNERDGDTTWRCKECHGWDYQGADGAYGSGSHFTGFSGVIGAVDMTAEEIASWLDGTANSDHDFSAYFDDTAIAKMVAFLQTNVIDMDPYINADKTINGDVVNGQGFFDQACSICHGDDGKSLNFGDESDPVFLGDLALDNPWETLHKAANGQPAVDGMPAGLNLGWSWQELVNVLQYIQTLGQ